MEQAAPFPRMASPPPPATETPAPTPSYPPGFSPNIAKVGHPIHPGENIFKETVTLSDPSPAHDAASLMTSKPSSIVTYNQPLTFENVRRPLGPFIVAQPIEQTNEKLHQLRKKKDRRDRRKERNVKVVKKAEDMEGYEGEKSLNDLLQSLGEKTAEEKKQKLRKTKENKDKKERKRRSVEKTSEDEVREEEEDAEKEIEQEQPGTKNGVVESLQEFSQNFNLVSSEPSELRSLKLSEGLTQSTDSLNFVKVTGKKKSRKLKEESGTVKEYTRRSKEDTGRPPPAPGGTGGTLERKYSAENRRTSNYSLRSRDVPLPAAETPTSPPPTTDQSKLNTRIEDFPALNTSQDFPALPQSDAVTECLPSAWSRRSGGSDSAAVITAPPRCTSDQNLTRDISSRSEQESGDSVQYCDNQGPENIEPVDSAAKDKSVSSEAGEVDIYQDISADVTSASSISDPLEKIGFTQQDLQTPVEKFEFDTRSNPVVGDSFLDTEELSFGFEVNEELVSLSMAGESTTPSSPLQSGQTTPTPRPASPAPSGQSTPLQQEQNKTPTIDTIDKAILSYGSSAVLIPIPGPLLSYGLVGGVTSNGIPPPFSSYLPQVNSELLETGLCESEDKTAAVSPESGISSASPLSWQVEGSPSQADVEDEGEVERSSSPPLQPGSYPRKKKQQEERSILQQVNHSLENWSRSSSPDTSTRSPPAGWTACVDISEEGGESTAPNYPEIVHFLHNNWKQFSKDKKVKIYGDKKRR